METFFWIITDLVLSASGHDNRQVIQPRCYKTKSTAGCTHITRSGLTVSDVGVTLLYYTEYTNQCYITAVINQWFTYTGNCFHLVINSLIFFQISQIKMYSWPDVSFFAVICLHILSRAGFKKLFFFSGHTGLGPQIMSPFSFISHKWVALGHPLIALISLGKHFPQCPVSTVHLNRGGRK